MVLDFLLWDGLPFYYFFQMIDLSYLKALKDTHLFLNFKAQQSLASLFNHGDKL